MQSLIEVLEMARDARESLDCGRANNAAWMPELIEDDLAALVDESVQQRHLPPPHSL